MRSESKKKNSESKSLNFVQHYDQIRELMRIFYLYGCFEPNELKSLKIIGSESEYNQKKRKIAYGVGADSQHYTDEKSTLDDGTRSRKILSFIHDMHEDDYNYFCDTYKIKKIGKDLRIVILVLQLLTCTEFKDIEEFLNLPEVNKVLSYYNEDGDLQTVDSTTVKRHFKELLDSGLLNEQVNKKRKEYSLKTDVFSELFQDDEFSVRFLDFIALLREKIQPYVCGNMLLETALLYLESKTDASVAEKYETPFFVKDGHFEQVLDDEVLYRLITAMSECSCISFCCDDKEYDHLYPVKVVTNMESGMRYLFAYDSKQDWYDFFPLDMITKLEVDEKSKNSFDYNELEEEYRKRTRYSFSGVTCINDGEEPVEVILSVRKTKNNDFLKKVKKLFNIESDSEDTKTHKSDKITLSDDGKSWTVTVMVNTFEEMLPWLRRNMADVKAVNNEVVETEISEWRKMYGTIQ